MKDVAEEVEKQSDYKFMLNTHPKELAGNWKWLVERKEKGACKVFGLNNCGVGFAFGRHRFGEKIKSSVHLPF